MFFHRDLKINECECVFPKTLFTYFGWNAIFFVFALVFVEIFLSFSVMPKIFLLLFRFFSCTIEFNIRVYTLIILIAVSDFATCCNLFKRTMNKIIKVCEDRFVTLSSLIESKLFWAQEVVIKNLFIPMRLRSVELLVILFTPHIQSSASNMTYSAL